MFLSLEMYVPGCTLFSVNISTIKPHSLGALLALWNYTVYNHLSEMAVILLRDPSVCGDL